MCCYIKHVIVQCDSPQLLVIGLWNVQLEGLVHPKWTHCHDLLTIMSIQTLWLSIIKDVSYNVPAALFCTIKVNGDDQTLKMTNKQHNIIVEVMYNIPGFQSHTMALCKDTPKLFVDVWLIRMCWSVSRFGYYTLCVNCY